MVHEKETGGFVQQVDGAFLEFESMLEFQYSAYNKENPFDAITLVAALVLMLGVRGGTEVVLALLAGLMHNVYGEGSMVDGAISFETGVQFTRGQYKTAAFPAGLEFWKDFRQYEKGEIFTKTNISRSLIGFMGFLSQKLRIT